MKHSFLFTYQINKTGKASGIVGNSDRQIPFEVTSDSNPLLDLLKGMANLIYEPSHLWGEDNICWVDWYCSEGGLRWVLSTDDGHQLRVKIIQQSDIFDDATKSVAFDESFELLSFYYIIISKLDILIKQIGLLNYEQKWQKDEFPLTYFLLLKKHLLDRGHWIPINQKAEVLSDEIDFLLA